MGWFDSITKRDDPLRDLDPSLREYLESQAPKQYKTTTETATNPAQPQQSYREQLGLKHTDPEDQHRQKQQQQQQQQPQRQQNSLLEDVEEEAARPLPAESLFPDGRYAHLWKNYRPVAEINEAGKSDQEKLLDIVGGYKERQAEVGRAALENCSNEQWAVHECFRSGSWSAVATMCKAENRALNRCMMMQSRFLRALGYLTMQERSEVETEKIQMHADRLYQRMLEEEKQQQASESSAPPADATKKRDQIIADLHLAGIALQKEAAAQDTASPTTIPISITSPPQQGTVTYDTLPAHVRDRLAKERFAGLEGPALELAKREMDHDIAFNQQAVLQLNERYRRERDERLRRQEAGEERLGDVIKRWFDFRKYDGDGIGGKEKGKVAAAAEVGKGKTDV